MLMLKVEMVASRNDDVVRDDDPNATQSTYVPPPTDDYSCIKMRMSHTN